MFKIDKGNLGESVNTHHLLLSNQRLFQHYTAHARLITPLLTIL